MTLSRINSHFYHKPHFVGSMIALSFVAIILLGLSHSSKNFLEKNHLSILGKKIIEINITSSILLICTLVTTILAIRASKKKNRPQPSKVVTSVMQNPRLSGMILPYLSFHEARNLSLVCRANRNMMEEIVPHWHRYIFGNGFPVDRNNLIQFCKPLFPKNIITRDAFLDSSRRVNLLLSLKELRTRMLTQPAFSDKIFNEIRKKEKTHILFLSLLLDNEGKLHEEANTRLFKIGPYSYPLITCLSDRGKVNEVAFLLQSGANPNVLDGTHQIPLYWTLYNYYKKPLKVVYQMAQLLLFYGSVAEMGPGNQTPLTMCFSHSSSAGRSALILALLKKGAHIEKVSSKKIREYVREQLTPINRLSDVDREIILLLLENKKVVTQDQVTWQSCATHCKGSLRSAIENRQKEVLVKLFTLGFFGVANETIQAAQELGDEELISLSQHVVR